MERKYRLMFGFGLMVTFVLFIYFGYYKCSGVSQFECGFSGATKVPHIQPLKQHLFSGRKLETVAVKNSSVSSYSETEIHFKEEDLYREYDLDLEEEDVLVFVHIQKTGGTTFGRHLVKNLDVEPPCECYKGRKKCDCYTKGRKIWLFSRYSTGWVCGLHADFTELTACVDKAMDTRLEKFHRKRTYHFITLLRQPVYRFISEWKHVQRGATWKGALHWCKGREPTEEELPFCYTGEDWSGVTLDEFLECPHNLARNRQTRMLADLSLVNCYNHSGMPELKYKEILLESAKENLKNMAFVGLLEYQNYTQILFENTFNLEFINDFEQYSKTHSGKAFNKITGEQIRKIQELNDLDVKLYHFAKELFFQRLSMLVKEKGVLDPEELKETEEDDEDYYEYDYEEDDSDETDDSGKVEKTLTNVNEGGNSNGAVRKATNQKNMAENDIGEFGKNQISDKKALSISRVVQNRKAKHAF